MGNRKGIRPVKKLGVRFVGGNDLTGVLHLHHIGDILVPADPGPAGKWPSVKMERDEIGNEFMFIGCGCSLVCAAAGYRKNPVDRFV